MSLSATVLLIIIKGLEILKRLLAAFFIYAVYKPLGIIFRIVFYKVIVRAYSLYLMFIKKLGWSPQLGKDFFLFLFQQKFVHVLVVIITIILFFVNITAKTKAGGLTDRAHRTILSNLVKSELFGEFEEDGQLIVESFDKEAALSNIQQTYLDNLDSVRAQPRAIINDSEEDTVGEEAMMTIQGGASMVKPDIAATTIAKRPRKEIITYIVKPGDSPSTIAAEYEISVNTILWANDLSAYSIIRPGDELEILPMSGITHKVAKGETIGSIAKKYSIKEEKIYEANKLDQAGTLSAGIKLIIPGGKEKTYTAYTTARYTGISAIRDIVKAPNAKPAVGNKMNWPTVGARITQYYSWRHHAVDIANKIGTPIYAADAGTIEVAGWGTGYGNQIVIDHGGGKKTRYAHLSKFHVEKGQKVSKGETIGEMGSTGWSTGPHLHFEVIINGRKYNPLNYIK